MTADICRTINDLLVLVDHYNEELCNILDKHTLQEHHLVALMKLTSWTSDDIKFEKPKRRKLERRWRRTQLQID